MEFPSYVVELATVFDVIFFANSVNTSFKPTLVSGGSQVLFNLTQFFSIYVNLFLYFELPVRCALGSSGSFFPAHISVGEHLLVVV